MKTNIRIMVFFLIFFAPAAHGQAADSDADGLADEEELTTYFTDPALADTDGDGFSDGDEIETGFSPRFGDTKKLIQVDSDKDYLNDAWELALGTGLMNPDSDGDTYLDGTEVAAGYDPLTAGEVKKEKRIEVGLKTQHLEYYFGDVLFGSFPISGGVARLPTPKGEFTVLDKVPVKHYAGVGWDYPNTKWNLHFTTKKLRYFIHGAYWHNDFGKPKSHGCVNVSYENMEPLYWFSQIGTRVVIN
ncbi:MAG: L,D-transpeptidase [Candidatus Komeilibacteria bacterium]|nr:L,D-transpeptidase [Candidatus Komeilibacteria bacterium]